MRKKTSEPKRTIKKIDAQYILHEIQHLLHFDKGFPFTYKEVLILQGKAVSEYLHENREKYVKPIVFLVLSAVIYTLIMQVFQMEFGMFNTNGFAKTEEWENNFNLNVVNNWVDTHLAYSTLIISVSSIFGLRIYFIKRGIIYLRFLY